MRFEIKTGPRNNNLGFHTVPGAHDHRFLTVPFKKCFQAMRGSEVMMATGFSTSSVAPVCFANMYALPFTQIASSASALSCLDSATFPLRGPLLLATMRSHVSRQKCQSGPKRIRR